MPDSVQEEVKAAIYGGGGEASTPETPEPASSPEVKTDPAPSAAPVKPEIATPATGDGVAKLQQQIENLNIALKKERESGKQETETMRKELEESKGLLTRLKGAFAPEPPAQTEPEEKPYLTSAEAEAIWERKEQERLKKEEESKRSDAIKTEITTLETEWNGADGKPRYDDAKVLEWQKENGKLYLSPSEAFAAMNRTEIIDWEVKQRLAGKKPTHDVETPSTTPGEHEPKESMPKNEAETRNAVIEAINNAEAEI
jgi:hypothetical protein